MCVAIEMHDSVEISTVIHRDALLDAPSLDVTSDPE
jgi:hypothetical protein